ncbi:MAG: hypothetical protein N3B18_05065 [Desulfobacterota bacterium]|nr:hypothetical protein [Thermodesulfobacteriota bacterium]
MIHNDPRSDSASSILQCIERARSVLIVVSRPVDPDCVGTALAAQWWLAQQGKQSCGVSFFEIPPSMHTFPDIDAIEVMPLETFAFEPWNAIMLVDGSSWSQFFGLSWRDVIQHLDMNSIINIDHHQPDDICAALSRRCLNRTTSSTAQLFYETFLAPFHIKPPARVAEYLYRALLYDTRHFRNEYHKGMYLFAEKLIELGVDHAQAVEVSYDRKVFDFFIWALTRTKYIADIEATLLTITDEDIRELERTFGPSWTDCDTVYKEVFLRQTEGYAYGLILTQNRDGTVKLSWRTRSTGNRVSIRRCATAAGFHAGGHYHAGGGVFYGSLRDAEQKLLAAIREELATHRHLPHGTNG